MQRQSHNSKGYNNEHISSGSVVVFPIYTFNRWYFLWISIFADFKQTIWGFTRLFLAGRTWIGAANENTKCWLYCSSNCVNRFIVVTHTNRLDRALAMEGSRGAPTGAPISRSGPSCWPPPLWPKLISAMCGNGDGDQSEFELELPGEFMELIEI